MTHADDTAAERQANARETLQEIGEDALELHAQAAGIALSTPIATPATRPALEAEMLEKTRPLVQAGIDRLVKRKKFTERTTCKHCGEGKSGTLTTFDGTPLSHRYHCGSTLDRTGIFDQSKRCTQQTNRQNRSTTHDDA